MGCSKRARPTSRAFLVCVARTRLVRRAWREMRLFSCDDDAGDSGEIRDGMNIAPLGPKQVHYRLGHRVADLHHQPAAFAESFARLRNEAANDVQAVLAGEYRNSRLELLDHVLNFVL